MPTSLLDLAVWRNACIYSVILWVGLDDPQRSLPTPNIL